jgi:hypothetical protein
MNRFPGGKRKFVVVATALVGLAALAFGVAAGFASSGPSQIKVQFQKGNGHCGIPTSKKFIGSARVEATKGLITVAGALHGAIPGKYVLQLWVPGPPFFVPICFLVGSFDTFSVDGSGDGNFSGAIAASGQQSFFLDVHNEDLNVDNDTTVFKIGGL